MAKIKKVTLPFGHSKDVIGLGTSSSSSSSKSSQRKVFNEDEASVGDDEEQIEIVVEKSKGKRKEKEDEDDAPPEEVSANRADIQQLRELHEQMIEPAKKAASKRKRPEKKAEPTPDVALDDSVLDALDSELLNGNGETSKGKKKSDDEKEEDEDLSRKINVNARNSRQM